MQKNVHYFALSATWIKGRVKGRIKALRVEIKG